MEDIRYEQKRNNQLLNELYNTVKTKTCIQPEDALKLSEDLFSLPINGKDNLDKLNELIQDQYYFIKLVTYLAAIGGANVKDNTRRVMQALITNSVAKDFNWAGCGKKQSFKDKGNIVKAIQCAIQKNPRFQAQNSDIENAVKSWLCFDLDRNGGHNKRKPLKETQNQENIL